MNKDEIIIEKETYEKKSILYKFGIALIVVSLLSWLIPLIAPFTPYSTKVKAGIITGAIVFAEVVFWIGVLLVGKEVAAKFRGYLNPKNWRKNNEK